MSPVLFWANNGTIDKTYNCYRKNNFPRKIFSDNTLFNAVIGLAALSGVLALLLSITVYLICKMRITHGNPINLNFSHLQAPGRGIFTGQKRIQMLTRSTLAQFCDLQHHLVVLLAPTGRCVLPAPFFNCLKGPVIQLWPHPR